MFSRTCHECKTRIARRLRRIVMRDGWCEVKRLGHRWRLRPGHFIDDQLIERGIFEADTTRRAQRLVQPGMHILDVGANFGYFTVLFAQLVGPRGHVWAFEPSRHYRDRLRGHLEANHLEDRVTVVPYGLSDREESARLHIGECSATLHPMDNHPVGHEERVELRRLDDVARELNIDEVDLIKVDIDGHEPAFLRGAQELIRVRRPIMIVEFYQGNLDQAGGDVRQQKRMLEALGYELRSDRTGRAFTSRFEFLYECGNFTHSANVWAHPKRIVPEGTNPNDLDDPADIGRAAA